MFHPKARTTTPAPRHPRPVPCWEAYDTPTLPEGPLSPMARRVLLAKARADARQGARHPDW